MKGIILAGGKGSRLYPSTRTMSKQLLPVYDKPMIYYPMSVLMKAGIRDILIIATPRDLPRFQELFQTGEELGLRFSYAEQPHPEGIAQAFIIGESFIGNDSVALILGDNILYGNKLDQLLCQCKELNKGAIIFGYEVKNPERYGVIAFNSEGRVTEIVEKPPIAPSPYSVIGLYFYDNEVISIAKSLQPSKRGELEITDINNAYIKKGTLQFHLFERGFAWLDAGTHEDLHKAAQYVYTLQERQGINIACIEEIAYEKGYITKTQLDKLKGH